MRFCSICKERDKTAFAGIQAIITCITELIKLKLTKLMHSAKIIQIQLFFTFFLQFILKKCYNWFCVFFQLRGVTYTISREIKGRIALLTDDR